MGYQSINRSIESQPKASQSVLFNQRKNDLAGGDSGMKNKKPKNVGRNPEQNSLKSILPVANWGREGNTKHFEKA